MEAGIRLEHQGLRTAAEEHWEVVRSSVACEEAGPVFELVSEEHSVVAADVAAVVVVAVAAAAANTYLPLSRAKLDPAHRAQFQQG